MTPKHHNGVLIAVAFEVFQLSHQTDGAERFDVWPFMVLIIKPAWKSPSKEVQ